MDPTENKIEGAMDKMKGKTNQVVGDLRGDKEQSLKGHAQEAKGDVKDAIGDVKSDVNRKERRS